jgi:predicted nucleotidyltransferase component of viral defense system
VFVDDTFALKGGTAINLFVRDLPRLSVDLDLVFANHELPREQAIVRIRQALCRKTQPARIQDAHCRRRVR